MRALGFLSQAPLSVSLVVRVIPVEPHDSAIAFESEDMSGDPIEKPAVVADDERRTAELVKRFLEGAERVDVEIVGGLVEKQEVRAFFQHPREMDAVALAA